LVAGAEFDEDVDVDVVVVVVVVVVVIDDNNDDMDESFGNDVEGCVDVFSV
jgi:hypothetical protein